MNNQNLINELQELEAWALGTAERAARLRKMLQPVSTGRSKKSQEVVEREMKVAQMLAKKHKRLMKKAG